MKKLWLLSLVLAIGCASFSTNSYRVIGVTTTSVEAARQAWVAYENTGAVTQADHDKVQGYYVKYQAVMKVANDAFVAYYLNNSNSKPLETALAAVSASAGDFVALVEMMLPASKGAVLKASLPKGK